MSQSPGAGPDFSPPGFEPCYRHPERMTGISCQRCGKPICGECMQPASVGFQCPRCVSGARSTSRQPRTAFGAALRPGGGSATKVLMVVLAVVAVLDLVSRGQLALLLGMSSDALYAGQLWRLVTASLVSGSLIGVLMNLLVLWLAGRAIESELGRWRFVVLYLAAGLGGATLYFVLAPDAVGAYVISGAYASVIGLLAANAIGKLRSHEDIRGDIGLLVLLLLYNILLGFSSYGWLMMIGGIVVGALVGVVLAYAPRRNRTVAQAVGLLGVLALCLAGLALKLFL